MRYRFLMLPLLMSSALLLSGCDDDEDMGITQPDFVTHVQVHDGEGNQTDTLTAGEDATVVLSIRNRSGEPQTLEFSDERSNDFLIKNANGEVVKLWSAGRGFGEVITEAEFEAGETREFDMLWEGARDDEGSPLPAGSYEVQAWAPTGDTDGTDDLRPSEFRSTLEPIEIVEAGDF